jgi:hypothetical protein
MLGQPVALEGKSLRRADAQEACVLAGAVVVEPAAVHGAALEVILGRASARE